MTLRESGRRSLLVVYALYGLFHSLARILPGRSFARADSGSVFAGFLLYKAILPAIGSSAGAICPAGLLLARRLASVYLC